MNNYAISLQSLRYGWSNAGKVLLNIDSLNIAAGEKVFLFGPSGSGKSTLLNLLAGTITPQQGHVNLLGTALNDLSYRQRDAFRAQHLGIIFQQFNLIPYLNVIDNLRLRVEFLPRKQQQFAYAQIPQLLTRLGLAEAQQQAYRLSVGQQQRVALARALLGAPDIVIADEPTSALDADLREEFMTLLFELLGEKTTLIFVSHDHQLRNRFDRAINIKDFHDATAVIGVEQP
uniref:ABC transporter ATP-binding protein n=1 Tax=Cellvibrio fontiphilus TaxID=1815559 RepID=UPI002B4BB0C5|nr:ABC transporter ATP-binding protein [Cellvibrio fontiphilus]